MTETAARAQIGVTGLAVMGSNIARNFARHGHTVALHNRSIAKTDALIEKHGHEGDFVRTETVAEFVAALEKPRRVLIMVKAGAPTDAVIEELAGLLGGAVGCSRAVTMSGWRPHTDQVGQTGNKIAPEIYIACGVSGATQHIAGAKGATRCKARLPGDIKSLVLIWGPPVRSTLC